MRNFRRKRHKVVARRSHTAYRWRAWGESLATLFRLTFFIGSAGLLAWGAHRLWKESPGLTVQGVVLDGDAPEALRERAGIKPGQPFFSFSTRATQKRLAAEFPQLKEIRVTRGLDRRVHIGSVPRAPLAKALLPSGWAGVDEHGVFPLEGEGGELPILAGVDGPEAARRALAFWRVLKNTKERWTEGLYKIKMSSDGEVSLFLRGETPIFWGPPDAEAAGAKAARLARVFAAPEGALGYDYVRFVDDRRVVAKPMSERPNG